MKQSHPQITQISPISAGKAGPSLLWGQYRER
ncbi:MAG: hypothetical protein QOH71_1750 [Blastocatellia bacterium]|jgi:hypothetical protein|nr:hypothetical protein [Blastocatellia bacterium]